MIPAGIRAAAFIAARQTQAELEAAAKAASDVWRAVPGVGSGSMGLTPDAVKLGAEYRSARAAYERAADRLKRFTALMVREFGPELRAERRAKREAGLR